MPGEFIRGAGLSCLRGQAGGQAGEGLVHCPQPAGGSPHGDGAGRRESRLSGKKPERRSQAMQIMQTMQRGEGMIQQEPGMVLVVEDDEDIAHLLCYSLRKNRVPVAVAHDGLTAFALVEELRPALVLLDLMLPRLDGREVCRLIRSHPDRDLAGTPVVMLSALGTPEDIEKGMGLGANAYFAKPYSVKDVVSATMEWLGGYRLMGS
ncbi:MAG: response regulator [Deltaproteobacteria bacterium]|nr:MAG: response regulator [Deltaproteobacteria bacterium]